MNGLVKMVHSIDDEDGPYKTVSEVAEYFEVDKDTIRRWGKKSGLPTHKMQTGEHPNAFVWLYTESDILAFEDHQSTYNPKGGRPKKERDGAGNPESASVEQEHAESLEEHCPSCGMSHRDKLRETFPDFFYMSKILEVWENDEKGVLNEKIPDGLNRFVFSHIDEVMDNLIRHMVQSGLPTRTAFMTVVEAFFQLGFYAGHVSRDEYPEIFEPHEFPKQEEIDEALGAAEKKIEEDRARKNLSDEQQKRIIEIMKNEGLIPEGTDLGDAQVKVMDLNELRRMAASASDEKPATEGGSPGFYL